MKMKLLGTAVTAALLSVSMGAFAQAGGGGAAGSAAVGSTTGGDQKGSITDRSTGTSVAPRDRATPRDSANSRSTTHCDALSGAEMTRCMRDARASSGSSGLPSDSPTTDKPKSMGEGGGTK